MEKKWELLEKYFDNELSEKEQKKLNQLMQNDEELYNEFIQMQTIHDDIKTIVLPIFNSKKKDILNIVDYIQPDKKRKFLYALPVLFSYSIITTLFIIAKFKDIIFSFTWNNAKGIIVTIMEIMSKISIIFAELDFHTMLIMCMIPIMSVIITFSSGYFIKKEINKGGNR